MEGRAWDLPDWYADPSKAIAKLGWKPEIGLEQGLRSTADWVKRLSDADVAMATKTDPNVPRRSLSAIVACYKDEQAIPVMYRRLTDTFRKLDIDYEIIFVNDCSPDDCARVIRELSTTDSHVIGISHSRNFGSQMAFRSGMELASMDGVVLLDGDLQDPPELIEQFYEQWEAGYDVVYGRRVRREMSWFWGALYKLFYRVFAAFSYVEIPLDAGDFSLIDRRVVGWLLNCPERDLFVRGLRAYVGFKQTGVDYRPARTHVRPIDQQPAQEYRLGKEGHFLVQQHTANDADVTRRRVAWNFHAWRQSGPFCCGYSSRISRHAASPRCRYCF